MTTAQTSRNDHRPNFSQWPPPKLLTMTLAQTSHNDHRPNFSQWPSPKLPTMTTTQTSRNDLRPNFSQWPPPKPLTMTTTQTSHNGPRPNFSQWPPPKLLTMTPAPRCRPSNRTTRIRFIQSSTAGDFYWSCIYNLYCSWNDSFFLPLSGLTVNPTAMSLPLLPQHLSHPLLL